MIVSLTARASRELPRTIRNTLIKLVCNSALPAALTLQVARNKLREGHFKGRLVYTATKQSVLVEIKMRDHGQEKSCQLRGWSQLDLWLLSLAHAKYSSTSGRT